RCSGYFASPISLPPSMDHKEAAKEFFASYRRFKEAIEQVIHKEIPDK
ncbi:17636_t:CDS:1, partial [Cetraspora pellucida]